MQTREAQTLAESGRGEVEKMLIDIKFLKCGGQTSSADAIKKARDEIKNTSLIGRRKTQPSTWRKTFSGDPKQLHGIPRVLNHIPACHQIKLLAVIGKSCELTHPGFEPKVIAGMRRGFDTFIDAKRLPTPTSGDREEESGPTADIQHATWGLLRLDDVEPEFVLLNQWVIGRVLKAIAVILTKFRERSLACRVQSGEEFADRLFAGDRIEKNLGTRDTFENLEMGQAITKSRLSRPTDETANAGVRGGQGALSFAQCTIRLQVRSVHSVPVVVGDGNAWAPSGAETK